MGPGGERRRRVRRIIASVMEGSSCPEFDAYPFPFVANGKGNNPLPTLFRVGQGAGREGSPRFVPTSLHSLPVPVCCAE